MIKEKLKTENKLKTEDEIEMKDLENLEWLMSAQFDFFGKRNLDITYGQIKTNNWLHWS